MSVALAYNTFTGRLQVNDTPMQMRQSLAMAAFGMALDDDWFGRAWIGGVLDGTLVDSAHSGLTGAKRGSHRVTPGWVVSAQATRRLLPQDGVVPFINTTFTIGWSQMGTERDADSQIASTETRFLSTDLRVAATAGWTIADVWTPYVGGRAFAAPFYWYNDGGSATDTDSLSGQDVNHYQVAIGSTVTVGKFSAFFDWSMLGEKAVTAGLGYMFGS